MNNYSWRELVILPLAFGLLALLLFVAQSPEDAEPVPAPMPKPDFGAFTDVNEKKLAFFNYVVPHVHEANDRTRDERRRLESLRAEMANGAELPAHDSDWLVEMMTRYRVRGDVDLSAVDALLKKVDEIPPSLALAQAANESAWGTSRFARTANNYFGLWCFTANCGVVPQRREAGKNHEVAKFDDVGDGVDYYVRTLNSHPAYESMRSIRQSLRDRGEPVTGMAMAEGLLSYSERGHAYVEEIREMIRYNKLQRYNQSSAENR